VTRYAFTALAFALVLAGSASAANPPAKTLGSLVVKVGMHRTYSRTELRPGEAVVCRYGGRTLTATAPTGQSGGNGAVWPLRGLNDKGLFHLNVTIAPAAEYVVTCGIGGVHSQLVVIP
jgi:hypothetical protein